MSTEQMKVPDVYREMVAEIEDVLARPHREQEASDGRVVTRWGDGRIGDAKFDLWWERERGIFLVAYDFFRGSHTRRDLLSPAQAVMAAVDLAAVLGWSHKPIPEGHR